MFQRILVANRGEIALRVIRACKELDIEVVAVYSQADRAAPYLAQANRAICIGKAASADSYLNVSRIIAAAEVADAQAIHPGYGFLSENPDFAEVCRSSGFEFIGPPHEAIRRMGLKTEAKLIAAQAEVACVPGSEGVIANDAQATRLARAIGYPVLIKAAAGGGGKGMRVCRDESNLAAALQTARNEAEAAFKNASVYIEKFIDRPRHVEVQILADAHGHIVYCWDRDCTLQRRHQKLVEESPAPTLPLQVRTQLGEAAVRLARAAGYVNAGTCEFLVDTDNQFLLHRGQRPDPGRTSRHRDGHRHRPGQAADQDRGRPSPPVLPGRCRRPRTFDRMPDQFRRPRPRLSPVPRADHRAASPRWPRRPLGFTHPGRIYRSAKLRLAPGQADRPRPNSPRGARHHAAGTR